MKFPSFSPVFGFLAFGCGVTCALAQAPAGTIHTSATIAPTDGGKQYRVQVAVSERSTDGKIFPLPGLGVSQNFGSPAKTGETIKKDSVRVDLETVSKAGDKNVTCVVSVTVGQSAPVQSEFVLTLP
jgi:hypothetical protein